MSNDGDRADTEAPSGAAAFEMALWQLTEQQRSIESLDTKAGVAFTAALAFAGLSGVGTAVAIGTDVVESAAVAIASGIFVLVAFGWTLFSFHRATRTTSWVHGPEGQYLIEVAAEYPEPQVRLWLAGRIVDSCEENDPLLEDKATWFQRTLIGVMTQGLVATAGLVGVAVTATLFQPD